MTKNGGGAKPIAHVNRYRAHVNSAILLTLCVLVVTPLVLNGCAASKSASTSAADKQAKRDDHIDPIAFQHFSIGTIADAEGDLQTAIAQFQRALRFDPDSYEIRLALAEALFKGGAFDDAINTADAITPRDQRVLDFLGKCYRYTNRNEDAAAMYRDIIARDTTDASAYWYLARIAERDGKQAEAAGYLEHAARLRSNPRYFTEAGDLFSRAGQYEDAIRAYDQSIQRDSTVDNRRAFVSKAQALEALNRFGDALTSYRYALALQPEDISIRKRIINHFLFAEQPDSAIAELRQLLAQTDDPQEQLRLAILLHGTGNNDEAEKLFQQSLNERITYIPLYYLGRIAVAREQYDTAKTYFRRAIAVDDTISDGWISLMATLMDQDSTAAMVAIGEEAAEKTGDAKPFWYFIGMHFAQRQSYDTALVWLQRAFALDSTDSRVQFALGSALERGGQFAQAALVFSNLLHREPQNAPALNYLGYMYADSGIHLEESLKLLKRALAIDPNNGAYLDSYGWALFKLGRLEEAEVQIRKALDVLGSDPVIHEHLGDILAAQGRDGEAREHWQHALEIDPQNQALKTKLEP